MKDVHKTFARGRMPDGDSNDLPGDALLESVNLDLDVGYGEACVRPGLRQYTELGEMPVRPTLGIAPLPPNGGVWRLVKWIFWDSGITAVQHNTLLIYREESQTPGTWHNNWIIFTDAMHGGGFGSFGLLSGKGMSANDYITAPCCNPTAVNGQVRIGLGPGLKSLILTNLCEEGDRVLPTMTITEFTTPAPAAQQAFGEGGYIYAGWLWDYRQLYWSGPTTAATAYDLSETGTINGVLENAATSARTPLETCKYIFAVCPVYDDYDQQYGIPLIFTFDKAQIATPVVFKLTFNISIDTYNKRIHHFAVYGQKRDRTDRVDDNDLSRLATVAFSSLTAATTIYVDDDMFNAIEGTWAADSKGRPVTLHLKDATGSLNGWRLDVLTDYVDNEIDVKSTGFMLRRKRLYAWGINGDPGQSRIAISMPDDNTSGQLDVFWKLNRIWRDGSRETTWLEEWYDRMFLFNRHNSYWIDLELRLDDQVMGLDEGFGMGTDIVRTIAKGGAGLFWANYNSIYRFGSGTPEDIAENLWRREWKKIPRARRREAVAGYCTNRAEYWLSVQTADNVWSVYVWDDLARNWRVYRFAYDGTVTNFMPGGFINDALGRWIVYGRPQTTPGAYDDALVFDDTDGTTVGVLDDGDAIVFEMSTQWIGGRDTEMVIDKLDLQRVTTETMQVALYRDRIAAAAATVPYPATRTHMAGVPKVRCYEYRVQVTGTYSDTAADPPRIQQITIETKDDTKRSM